MRRALVVITLALVAAGCGNQFDPASLVNKLRLLAVKAQPPDVAFGQMTTLTATTANPGGSAPTISWDACLLPPTPGTGESVNQDCIDLPEGDPMLVSYGQGDSVSATMPMLDLSMVGLPDQTNGFYLPVRVKLAADGNTLVAFYLLRIFLGPLTPNPPNQNPTLTGIFTVPSADAGVDQEMPLDDANPLVVHNGDQIDLRARVADGSDESYVVYDGDPRTTPPRMATETIRISWYTTAGEFTEDVTGIAKPDTTLKLDKHQPASGSTIDLWVVARDERGGSDILHRTLVFQ
jgi:hypothetical protein